MSISMGQLTIQFLIDIYWVENILCKACKAYLLARDGKWILFSSVWKFSLDSFSCLFFKLSLKTGTCPWVPFRFFLATSRNLFSKATFYRRLCNLRKCFQVFNLLPIFLIVATFNFHFQLSHQLSFSTFTFNFHFVSPIH